MSRVPAALVCASCGNTLGAGEPSSVCPACGGLLDVVQQLPKSGAQSLRKLFDDRISVTSLRGPAEERSGVWRFRELVSWGEPDVKIVSHPEGNTPVLERARVNRYAGAGLLLKHEGHNPTGSFKDRGMTVAITRAIASGASAVACASTGNTSASMAAYAAQAEMPALVLIPAGRVARGKLAQTLAHGAITLAVRGDFDDCLKLIRQASEKLGFYLVNSVNPWRIEGQKSIVLELLQQLGWEAPDWIALPAGNLGNTAAFGKALAEALELGLISRMPRLLAVQASGAAPFAMSFNEEFSSRRRVDPDTVATAIRIGDPASWDRAVRAIRMTNGHVVAVPDAEILAAKRVIDSSGVGCEPASAASVAGVKALVELGRIQAGQSLVAVLTGHALKDPDLLLDSGAAEPDDPAASMPIEIDATLAAVESAFRSASRRWFYS